mmetsp:Transcript_22798/g.22017  ORF Transcript_22798/g.22017 Transcript_22798/m.22017 type:complete len:82 (-) Transcript_22798:54-299(-)|eukprot:CAMPEP_0170549958 /NCGR_PEP_ID=MMETSP0211-20121228/8035_1 /TAXON_ID=311385 /ORGANISM="Pseudokeronopsis sp., Strain OXSARD2" /LENGTH=81 /DNA_ID=CAMNT_0010856213 /DNA_START=278 /DNA_END=523 /DNA_ORIENTATION=-
MGYIGSNFSRVDKLHQFVSLNIETVRGYWLQTDNSTVYAYDLGSIEVERCTEEAFNNDTKYTDAVHVVGNYFCPVSRNLSL